MANAVPDWAKDSGDSTPDWAKDAGSSASSPKDPTLREKLQNRVVNSIGTPDKPTDIMDVLVQDSGALSDIEGSIASSIVPEPIKKYGKEAISSLADTKVGRAAEYDAKRLSEFGERNPAIGKPAEFVGNIFGAGYGAEGLAGAGKLGVKALDATSAATKSAGKAVADYAMKPPTDKGAKYIADELKKAGHSPEQIVELTKQAKENGLTIGEATQNPAILGMERKISGLNKPGGETVRGFIKDRVDPQNNVSIPFKLKSIADPLVKATKDASTKIGKIVESAPKVPIDMSKMETGLASEKNLPGSSTSTTIKKMQGYFDWAKENGNTFDNWHTVKQHLYDLKKEAADPTAVEKLDGKMIDKYYRNINDVLGGKSGVLPKELAQTSTDYAAQNKIFSENVVGRTIETTLSKMPEGGSPSQKLAYLHKKLAGSKELQDEIFGNMPAAKRDGILKLLDQAKTISRVGANDIVKSGVEGTPSLPLSKTQILGQMYDKVSDFVTRKDYNGLAKALTSPDVEKVAERLGYVKPEPAPKSPLRLTYQPENPEILVGQEGAKLASPAEQHANDALRARMKSLGIDMSTLRAQDMNAIRAMEQKYGQSEIGKFITENRNQPIMGRAWEVPQTEYDQTTVDKMLNRATMAKLDKAEKAQIQSQIEKDWKAHQKTVADLILEARKSAADLAKAKGESYSPSNMQELLLKAAKTGTSVEDATKSIR